MLRREPRAAWSAAVTSHARARGMSTGPYAFVPGYGLRRSIGMACTRAADN